MDLRQRLDPYYVFLNDYWQGQLGIEKEEIKYFTTPIIKPDANNLYHPKSIEELKNLLHHATEKNLKVRVRGAAQSVSASIYTDDYNDPDTVVKNINIELDHFKNITINTAKTEITVGAGCNIGLDPYDPSGVSTDANSLVSFLKSNNRALLNLPTEIHQTIGGFISTGCSGPSMLHSFEENILSITTINGLAENMTYLKSDDVDDHFNAIAASMGLLGIIIEVTLKCVEAFNVIGQETVTHAKKTAYDFFGDRGHIKQKLPDFLLDTEYTRLLWWPVKSLQRIITWQTRKMSAGDYTSETGAINNFKPRPYKPIFRKIAGTRIISEFIAAFGFQMIASWPKWFDIVTNNDPKYILIRKIIIKFAPRFYPMLIDQYLPCNNVIHPKQVFWDSWSEALPMDAFEYSNNLFIVPNMEVWVPIQHAQAVVNLLERFFDQIGYKATGFYATEIMGAKASNCWLSPAFQKQVIRFNFMWFNNATIHFKDFFGQFWKLMTDNHISCGLHWGKFLPDDSSDYLAYQYIKLEAFKALRKDLDPHNLFLNSYWQKHLGIKI